MRSAAGISGLQAGEDVNSGKVVITNEEGHEEIFVAGDAFTIEKGFKGTWHMPVTVRKFYAIYQAQ